MAYTIAAIFLALFLTGCYKLFEKAGRRGWEALISVYAFYIILKLNGRPAWWVIWLFIPLLNIIFIVIICIYFIKSYVKFTIRDQTVVMFVSFIVMPKWRFKKKTKYLGQSSSHDFRKTFLKNSKKSLIREWAGTVLFVLVADIFIRAFFIEGYVIPSGSMESSLLIGDYLFVSKINYGARTPITPIAFPFTHNTLPYFYTKSYWYGLTLPYYRLPGFTHVKKGDVVVFNYPMDADSPYCRPVDKRENYIKRCQGTPGDTLSVVDAQVYVNGKKAPNPPEGQPSYLVRTDGKEIDRQ